MQIIAHRGASGYAPENTESAIRLAATQGATWIEFDVRMSRDNVPLLMHDSKLNRTSNGKGAVIKQDWETLSQLDSGAWFSAEFPKEPILSFEKCVQLCSELGLFMQVELKPNKRYELELVAAINEVIIENNCIDNCLFSSFCKVSLAQIRQQIPKAKIAMLTEKITPGTYKYMQEYQTNELHFWLKKLNPRALQECHDKGIITRCYTVNQRADALMLKELGVSAIFTDYPDKMEGIG